MEISDTISEDERQCLQIPFPPEGLTITITATSGTIVLFATDVTRSTNDALFTRRVEVSDGTASVFIGPDDIDGDASTGDIVIFVCLEGQDPNNPFVVNTSPGGVFLQQGNQFK